MTRNFPYYKSILSTLVVSTWQKSLYTVSFSFVFRGVAVTVVGRRVDDGWESVRADGSERNGKNPRLKLMPFQPSFLRHRFFFLSFRFSCFAIRMKMWIVVRDVCVHCHSLVHRAQTGQVKVSVYERHEYGRLWKVWREKVESVQSFSLSCSWGVSGGRGRAAGCFVLSSRVLFASCCVV